MSTFIIENALNRASLFITVSERIIWSRVSETATNEKEKSLIYLWVSDKGSLAESRWSGPNPFNTADNVNSLFIYQSIFLNTLTSEEDVRLGSGIPRAEGG